MKKNIFKGSFKTSSFFLLFGIVMSFISFPAFFDHEKIVSDLKSKLVKVREENKRLEREQEELDYTLEHYNSDYAIEEFVRNHLNMVKENEVIYQVIDTDFTKEDIKKWKEN